ncbi:MAG: F0F1 ATP synthase subunit delta [Acidiferrobacterales bacterium]
MAERQTLARPYAEAVFKLAQEQDRLQAWSDSLGFMAAVMADKGMQSVLDRPDLENERFVALIKDICAGRMDQQAENLLRVLLENNRISLFAEIVSLFESFKARAESTIEVEVLSAFVLDAGQEKSIAAAMEKKLGCAVTLHIKEDESLIGGIVIRAGDLVIDGSAKGYLDELATHLTH